MKQEIEKCPMCDMDVKFSHAIYTCPEIYVYQCSKCDWFYEQKGTEEIKVLSLAEGIRKRPQLYGVDLIIEFIDELDLHETLKESIINRIECYREDSIEELYEDLGKNKSLICDMEDCFRFLEEKGRDVERIWKGDREYEEEACEDLVNEFKRVNFPFNVETEDGIVVFKV
jgi:hypothetical protein